MDGYLKFEYNSIDGNREISGPVLTFQIRYTYFGKSNKESTVYFGIRGASLSTLVNNEEMPVSPLITAPFQVQPVVKGGSNVFTVDLRLSSASLQELTMIAKERVFSMRLELFAFETDGAYRADYPTFMGGILSSPTSAFVQGKINGNDNTRYFQIPLESWLSALKDTGHMDYHVNTLIISSTDRKDVQDLVRRLHEARDLLIQGKPGDSVSKLRDIVTWAGYKRSGESDRYRKLKEYNLTQRERDDVVSLLDTLWKWTSHGHHQGLDENSVGEDQAKAAIDLCYVFVELLSRRETIGTLTTGEV